MEFEQKVLGGLNPVVAQVLVQVNQIRHYCSDKCKRPDPLKEDLPIPPDLRRGF
jgi:hypothetical protein